MDERKVSSPQKSAGAVGSEAYAGKVEYAYCLSCNGALARRKEYDTATSTKLVSDKRYEYDGLKLLRVDERCDADNDGEVEAGETTWRTVEASTYGPGIVGNLLAKRVYSYPTSGGSYCTSNGSTDYYYAYDHVGNVHTIFDDAGAEAYHFNQDAFGNELDFDNYTGDSWSTAAAAGISEHQTGRWIDDFSGLYFFHARWNPIS